MFTHYLPFTLFRKLFTQAFLLDLFTNPNHFAFWICRFHLPRLQVSPPAFAGFTLRVCRFLPPHLQVSPSEFAGFTLCVCRFPCMQKSICRFFDYQKLICRFSILRKLICRFHPVVIKIIKKLSFQ
jgi:hypothetical protein